MTSSSKRLLLAGISTVAGLSMHAQFDAPNDTICLDCAFPKTFDHDQDGQVDLILSTPGEDSIVWMRNLGAGDFEAPSFLTLNEHHSTFGWVGDLNNDGFVDLVGTSVLPYPDSMIVVLQGAMNGFITHIVDEHVGTTRPLTHARDMDGDDRADLLSLNGNEGETWYRQVQDWTFVRETISYWCKPEPQRPRGPYALADLDGDGDADLIAVIPNAGRIDAMWNLGGGRFGPPMPAIQAFVPLPLPALEGVELNGDAFEDVVIAGRPYYSNGIGSLTDPLGSSLVPSDYQTVANWDCDSSLEAVLSSSTFTSVLLAKLNDPVYYTIIGDANTPGARTTAADLNSDDLPDLIIGQVNEQTGVLYWRPNLTVLPAISFDLPFDTLAVDTVLFLGYATFASTGDTLISAWFASGPGVYNDSLFTALAPDGWVTITIQYTDFNDFVGCNGVTVTDSIFIAHTTTIPEATRPVIGIAPNPAADQVRLRWTSDKPLQFTMVDAWGRTVRPPVLGDGSGPDGMRLDVRGLVNGCYVLNFWDGNTFIGTGKVTVLH